MVAKILIDGRSGSGKTEFAAALASAWTGSQLVRLDDLYPGWDGLEAGSLAVHAENTGILSSFQWRRWDWGVSRPAEVHRLDPQRPIIVEGCGALSRANKRFATHSFWIELDDATRKHRALQRDGELYAPHWDQWAEQEERFIARENPLALADSVVSGLEVTRDVEKWLDRIGSFEALHPQA